MTRIVTLVAATLAASIVQAAPPPPKLACPGGSSSVELPAPPEQPGVDEGKVLRCLDGNGQPTGPEFWLRPNGLFAQRGSWSDGAKNGLWERWYPSGHLLSQYTYQAGQMISSRCLNEHRIDMPCTNATAPREWQPPAPEPKAAPAPTPAAPTPAKPPSGANMPPPAPPPAPPMPSHG